MKTKKAKFISTVSMALLIAIKTTPAYAWSNLTVFGDSLSDSGNIGRFTYDGNQNLLYDEILAHNLGDKLKPSNQGGQNFAQGGATAMQDFNEGLNTEEQVNTYLQSRGGRADSNGLYIHWVGANDIAAVAMNPLNAPEAVNNSADVAVSQVDKLLKAGARLVIVPNVPQLGLTPYIMQVILSNTGPSALTAAFGILNNATISSEADRKKTIKQAFYAAAEKVSDVPEKRNMIAQELYNTWLKLSAQLTDLTDSYNQQQENKLIKLNGNIVRVDIAGLFREVIASPNQFGVSNSLGMACPLGISSDECHSSDPGFAKDHSYVFADRLHPTPALEHIMADYIQSILDAPAQVASLLMPANQLNQGMHNVLDGHLQQQRIQPVEAGKLSFFGGYAGGRISPNPSERPNEKTKTSSLTLGMAYQMTENWQSGVIFSNSNQNIGSSSDFHYKLHGSLADVYTQVSFLNGGWLNADLHYSSLDYDNIQRSMSMGPAFRTEQGKTKGKQTGLRVQTGWDFTLNDYIITGPVASYALDMSKVSGYSENDSRSTSMRFSDQKFHSQIGSIGWRLESKHLRINPWVQVSFSHQFGDTESRVHAGLKSTGTSFVVPVDAGSQDWVNAAVGINVPFNDTFNAYAGISTSADKSNYYPVIWNVGINATF